MNTTTFQQRAEKLSALLKPIKAYPQCRQVTEAMVEEGEDCNSYNSSFYCEGWIKPIFENDYKGVLLQKVEDLQVIREYAISVRLEGLAHDEIPEEWNEENDIPQMEITDLVEHRQIWFSKEEQCKVLLTDEYLQDADDEIRESMVIAFDSMQDWAYEPKCKEYISKMIEEYEGYNDYKDFTLKYCFSPLGELLGKNAPVLNNYVAEHIQLDRQKRLYKTLKVAIRHGYEMPSTETDCSIYLDFLGMLELTGVCMTEPHYICPADYHAEHDRLARSRNKLEEEREKQLAKEREEAFAVEHAWLLGIEFDTEHFHFNSLDSVEAYRVEGDIMHHCIYKMGYYTKNHLLAMHIADHEGNRVATCTINLDTRKIDEIQPVCNDWGYDKTHDIPWRQCDDYKEIWNCLCARMHTFPKREKQQETETTTQINVA